MPSHYPERHSVFFLGRVTQSTNWQFKSRVFTITYFFSDLSQFADISDIAIVVSRAAFESGVRDSMIRIIWDDSERAKNSCLAIVEKLPYLKQLTEVVRPGFSIFLKDFIFLIH